MSLIKCRECGKEFSELAKSCPECGCPLDNEEKNTSINRTNSFAVAGFAVAMISLFLNFWGLMGAIATALSSVALNQISKTNENGKGLAIAGLIIGIISVIYAIFVMFIISSLF